MAFTGQITGDGRVWLDPSGGGIWTVPDGYDPQTSPYNPANASRNTSAGWSQGLGTSLAPTQTLNATPGMPQNPTPFTDPALNAPVYGSLAAPQAPANPLAQSMNQTQTWQSPTAVPGGPPEGTPQSGITWQPDPTGGSSGGLGSILGGNPLSGALAGAGGSGGLGSILGGPTTPSGPLTPDDYRTGVNNGTIPTGAVNRPVVDNFGNRPSDPSLGNQQATATQLPQDLTDALRQLMQNALDQGQQGQEAYTGITNDIRSFLDFSKNATTQSMGTQDALINSLMGRINPAIDQSLALMNQREGLSPEAMAALRGQAMEGSATQYGQNVSDLKTELARRGAAGGGDLPGSAGDIARGYGPLMASRDQQRSQGLRDTILADEQRKFESLGLNRQTAMQGLGQAAQLTGTLGQIYDPSKFLNSSQNAMSQLTGIVGARNDQASNALNQAGALGQALAGNQSEAARLAESARQANQGDTTANRRIDLDLASTSTGQILKNALIGTGFGALGNLLTGGDGDAGLIDRMLGGINNDGTAETKDAKTPGIGTTISKLLKNPYTIAIGAGILGVTAWLKSQAHHEANTFVQSFQNPFDQKVGQINDQFFELAQSGKLSKSQATDLKSSIKAAIDEYERQRIEFSKQGSDEKTVADQAKATSDQWYGADYKPYFQKLDDVIKGLA